MTPSALLTAGESVLLEGGEVLSRTVLLQVRAKKSVIHPGIVRLKSPMDCERSKEVR